MMIRVLVAIDPSMYREVSAHAVREQRPHAEVSTAEPKDLDDEAKRLAPNLVVCHRAAGVGARARPLLGGT